MNKTTKHKERVLEDCRLVGGQQLRLLKSLLLEVILS